MSNICPKSDGTHGLVYNLSLDDIQSIFKTYPQVKKKYSQNVPHRMTESDFWTKFFQSYYFRRDQISLASNDLFADCSNKEDEGINNNNNNILILFLFLFKIKKLEFKNKAEQSLINPVVILDNQKEISKDDGFGLTDFVGNKSGNLSHKNLIKRYNYYSMRVLNSMEDDEQNKNNKEIKIKQKKYLDEKIDDLSNEKDSNELKGAKLYLDNIDRYFYAPKEINNKINFNIQDIEYSESINLNTLINMSKWKMKLNKNNVKKNFKIIF